MAVTVPRPRTTMSAAQKLAAHCASQQQSATYGIGRDLQSLRPACPAHAGCVANVLRPFEASLWLQARKNTRGPSRIENIRILTSGSSMSDPIPRRATYLSCTAAGINLARMLCMIGLGLPCRHVPETSCSDAGAEMYRDACTPTCWQMRMGALG